MRKILMVLVLMMAVFNLSAEGYKTLKTRETQSNMLDSEADVELECYVYDDGEIDYEVSWYFDGFVLVYECASLQDALKAYLMNHQQIESYSELYEERVVENSLLVYYKFDGNK